MDSTVSIREVNQRTSAVLQRVSEGEELVVTKSGVPLARIIPFKPRSTYEQMVAEGRIHPAKSTKPIKIKSFALDVDLEQFMEEERADRDPF